MAHREMGKRDIHEDQYTKATLRARLELQPRSTRPCNAQSRGPPHHIGPVRLTLHQAGTLRNDARGRPIAIHVGFESSAVGDVRRRYGEERLGGRSDGISWAPSHGHDALQ